MVKLVGHTKLKGDRERLRSPLTLLVSGQILLSPDKSLT